MKGIKGLFIIIFTLLFVSSFILVLDPNSRRHLFTRAVHIYNLHQTSVITTLINQGKFEQVSEGILNYIDTSLFLSTPKNHMTLNIIHLANIAASRSATDSHLASLRKVFEKLLSIDENLYYINVWMAKLHSVDGKYIEAVNHIDKAISLSPVNDPAYRVGVDLAHKLKDRPLLNKYCESYVNSQFGGTVEGLLHNTVIKNASLREMVAQFNDNETFYPHSGISLEGYSEYVFTPEKIINFNKVILYLGITPGTRVSIRKIKIFNPDGVYKINARDLLIFSNSSYKIGKDDDSVSVIKTLSDTEVLSIASREVINNVQKIEIEMMFEKPSLPGCSALI